jgi:hypothetical protein
MDFADGSLDSVPVQMEVGDREGEGEAEAEGVLPVRDQ